MPVVENNTIKCFKIITVVIEFYSDALCNTEHHASGENAFHFC